MLLGNVTRQILVNNVGGTIYEYGWYNGSPWSSSYTNQGTGNWNIQYGQNTSNYELLYYVWSSYDSCTFNIAGNSEHYTFPDEVPPFVAPTLAINTTDIASGNLNGFSVYSGSVSYNDNMYFNIYRGSNNTNSDNKIGSFTLNVSSPFYVDTETSGTYAGQEFYYLTYRFMNIPLYIVNGNSYTVELVYPTLNGSDSIVNYWTFNLSADVQQNINDNTQQNLNDYLTSNEVDTDNIEWWIGNFPNSSFTFSGDTYLEQLFTILYNMFTDTTSNDFVFYIPNGNLQSITIPADYIESKLPIGIINLIRMVYWFIIARFMFKDVFGIVDKIRQGAWFDGATEDIKTEVL